MTGVNCIVPTGDWTGEGAIWHAAEKALYWVDIQRRLIHRHDTVSAATHTWFFDEPPVALALTERPDTLLVALGGSLVLWQPANDARADFAKPEDNWPKARLNDGRADPAGNFWVGSMFNNVASDGQAVPIDDDAAGRLFRIDGDGSVSVEKTGIGISNTFCWSPDKSRFYTGDTMKNAISVWDFDAETGTIANERSFFADFERGAPDGSAIDSEGCLWNARYGGACVVRVAPSGDILSVLEMPVENITTCAFGGPDLKTLYITTATGGPGAGARLAGGLFAFETEVPGTPENHFRIGG